MFICTIVAIGLFCLPVHCVSVPLISPYTVVCKSDQECQGDSFAYCNLATSKCACREETNNSINPSTPVVQANYSTNGHGRMVLFLINSRIKCLSGRSLNHPCSFDEQCHLVNTNSHCANGTICKCVHGFQSLNDSCHSIQERSKNSSGSKEVNTEILPIMIVMGLMFIGMCVALNMFSRARFRNQRGVFTAPRNAARALKDIQVKKSDRRYSTRPSIVSEHLEVVVDPSALEAQVADCQRSHSEGVRNANKSANATKQ